MLRACESGAKCKLTGYGNFVGHGSLPYRFRRSEYYWSLLTVRLPLVSQWSLMFIFPIFVAAVGKWTTKCLHGLSFKYSSGYSPRALAMNDVTKRSLQKAVLPSVQYIYLLDREDGPRSDGTIEFSFGSGESLVWNCNL